MPSLNTMHIATLLLTLASGALALPTNPSSSSEAITKRNPGDFYLRVMPLGASITVGEHSSDGNGYRKPLRDIMRSQGWAVNMVGSKSSGSMNDREMEAVSGSTIDQVSSLLDEGIHFQPNIIALAAGVNDMDQNIDIPNAANRIASILSKAEGKIPGVTILVGTIGPTRNGHLEQNKAVYNPKLREVVQFYQMAGQKVELAEMDNGYITQDDLSDDRHPNDAGYAKMANVWWGALSSAMNKGWIQAPNDSGIPDENND